MIVIHLDPLYSGHPTLHANACARQPGSDRWVHAEAVVTPHLFRPDEPMLAVEHVRRQLQRASGA